MDLATWDDPKVCRGLDILDGRCTRAPAKPEASGDAGGEEKRKKVAKDDSAVNIGKKGRKQGPSGLELGRRLLVVLKAPSVGPGAASGSSKGTAVRVVDHGAIQKEAVRRLFDAQVLLRSYEEQLQEKEQQVEQLYMALQEKKTKAQRMRNMAEEAAEDATDPLRTQTPPERGPVDKSATVAATMMAEENRTVVPYWIKNDQRSRETIEKQKKILMDEITMKGEHVEPADVVECLWQCGMGFAMRWAGDPDGELIKQNQALEAKFRDIQKKAMQESAMLRQHIRRIEKKHRDLQRNAKSLKLGLAEAASRLAKCQRALAEAQAGRQAYNSQFPREVLSAGQRGAEGAPRHPGAVAIVDSWLKGPGGGDSSERSPSAGGGSMSPVHSSRSVGPFGAPGGGFGGADRFGAGGGGFSSGGYKVSGAAMNYDYDMALLEAPSQQEVMRQIQEGIGMGSMANDDTLNWNATEEELEQMDHELFEPLMSFDPDIRELLIDVVDAKVRRILSLDPSKFVNGKLPFGLRPDGVSDMEAQLEAEIRRLNALFADIEQERDMYKAEAEALRQRIEEMRKRQRLAEEGGGRPVVPAGESEEESPRRSRPRMSSVGMQTPPVSMPSSPQNGERGGIGPPAGKYSEEDLQRRIAEAMKEMKAKLATLESQAKQKNEEIEDLRKRLMEAMKPKKEKKDDKLPVPEQNNDEILVLTARNQALQRQLDENMRERDELLARIRALERELNEERSKPPVTVEAPPPTSSGPPPEVDTRGARKEQQLLYQVLLRASEVLGVEASGDGQLAVKKVLGGDPFSISAKVKPGRTKSQAELDQCYYASVGFETWADEVMEALSRPKEEAPPPVQVKESPREGKCYNRAHDGMKKRIKELEDELARMVLTIDELRRRLEQLNPGDNEVLRQILSAAGLSDMVEAVGTGHLRDVFQRLYADAVQRIQRTTMVRERMTLAMRAYDLVVSSMGSSIQELESMPDFERLSQTTKASLRGMAYNVDRIFRRACEYAMSQGVEESLVRKVRSQDFFDDFDEDSAGAGISDAVPPAPVRAPARAPFSGANFVAATPSRAPSDRLPARRGDRPQRPGGAAGKGGKERDLGGVASPSGQCFRDYVAQIRATGDEWPKSDKLSPDRKLFRPDSAAAVDFRTIKAACAAPGGAAAVAPVLASSRSLPALPKGRGLLGAPEGMPIAPRSPTSPASAAAVDAAAA